MSTTKWSEESTELGRKIAQHIEANRIAAGDKVEVYCARLNISRATYQRLMGGHLGVAMGVLLEFAALQGKEEALLDVFQLENLFDLPVNHTGQPRKRVR